VQANNVYLEMLVDMGVLGLAAFVWLFVAPIRALVQSLRLDRCPTNQYMLLGIGLGVLAFLVHGLLDSFLAFTPTGLLIWLLLGMILGMRSEAQNPQVSGR
jgi:O-antigen ligase